MSTLSINAIEAENALRATRFRAIPDDIPLWRLREIVTKLGKELGLSGGAQIYAIDLLGLLTEADWRGSGQKTGRPVTYHGIRTYARKVGKSERTICAYEQQIVAAGLAHRSVKHARRHGGGGSDARRTGLDWRAFGEALPRLLARLAVREAEESTRLDLEARIRGLRRTVTGLAERIGGEKGRAALDEYARLGLARLPSAAPLRWLQHGLAALTLLADRLAALVPQPVDNIPTRIPSSPQDANRSEDSIRRIDTTTSSHHPKDEPVFAGNEPEPIAQPVPKRDSDSKPEEIPLERLWNAAPPEWHALLDEEAPVNWPVLSEVARHRAGSLGIRAHTWQQAERTLGPRGAVTALAILDRNRDHPSRPVRNVGGALVALTRRAEEAPVNLAPSLWGILARRAA